MASLGDEVECDGPPHGACCFPNGECLELPGDVCHAEGGHFRGPGTRCDEVECDGRRR